MSAGRIDGGRLIRLVAIVVKLPKLLRKIAARMIDSDIGVADLDFSGTPVVTKFVITLGATMNDPLAVTV